MKLTKLQLTNFKNYESLHAEFSEQVTCFAGQNGEGKTNLLDAIFYLCIGKSYFHSVEKFNRLHQTDFLRIEGNFQSEKKEHQVTIVSKQGAPKRIEQNGLLLSRVSEHLGFMPVCFIAPDDSVILLGGSETRRRFVDTALSQMNQNYLYELIEYNKILQQRNALLKADYTDERLLQTYNDQLNPLGKTIYGVREAYVQELSPLAQAIYEFISEEKEAITLNYKSQLQNGEFHSLLSAATEKDKYLKRTTVGIHRDDIQLLIDGHELKKVGSQGQQKTALLAIKLAEYELLAKFTKRKAILLLDDIFDKLDRGRVKKLFSYLGKHAESQLFITDTNGDRLETLLSEFGRKFEIFIVNNNQLKQRENK